MQNSDNAQFAQLFDVHAHHPLKSILPTDTHFACVSGFSPQTNDEVVEYAATHWNCCFSLGLAPQDVIRSENPEALLDDLKEKAKAALSDPALKGKFVAIGECGLDYHWAKKEEEHEKERVIFAKVIEFANSINKPLVIHSRDAEEDCIRMLHDAGCKNVLMHCFGGDEIPARLAASCGFLISIPPISGKTRKKVIKELPVSSIVIESDAPYIGKMSSDTMKSAELVAREKGMRVRDVLKATGENASRFFGVWQWRK